MGRNIKISFNVRHPDVLQMTIKTYKWQSNTPVSL